MKNDDCPLLPIKFAGETDTTTVVARMKTTRNAAAVRDSSDDDEGDPSHHGNSRSSLKQRKLKWLVSPIVLSIGLTVFGVYTYTQVLQPENFAGGESRSEGYKEEETIALHGGSYISPILGSKSISQDNKHHSIDGSDGPTFFVPSLAFEYQPPDAYNDDYLMPQCDPPRELFWEWSRFSSGTNMERAEEQQEQKHGPVAASSSNKTTNSTRLAKIMENSTAATSHLQKKRKRLLIGMYVGYDKYAELMYHTALVNKAYAKYWDYDMVVLQGTALSHCRQDDTEGRRVTLNKIRLLFHAIDHKDQWDQILLLDSDAMMYDFTIDVSSLLSDEYMVTGHHVKEKDYKNKTTNKKDENGGGKDDKMETSKQQPLHTWNINAGVLMWNLNHKLTKQVAYDWFLQSRSAVLRNNFEGDQTYLHKVLRKSPQRTAAVLSLPTEFAYGHGTVVRHYIRRVGHKDWSDPKLVQSRNDRIAEDAATVCERYHPVCDRVNRTIYETS